MSKSLADYLIECYALLTRHCFHNDGSPIFEQQKINRAVIACEFDLLVLLKNDFSSLEKIAMLTAKEYWLSEALELTPVMQLLAQKLGEGLVYKTPKIRAKRQCLLTLFNIEGENLFEGFENFLESFAVVDIPLMMVKPVLDNHFEGVLKRLDYRTVEDTNSFSFKTIG